MLQALTLLLVCQLLGETLVRMLSLGIPGPLVGMGLLLVFLAYKGGPDQGLNEVSDGILRNLSLLFVPAAVGVIQQLTLIQDQWLALGLAIIGSTLLTMLVTVGVFLGVARLMQARA